MVLNLVRVGSPTRDEWNVRLRDQLNIVDDATKKASDQRLLRHDVL